MKRSISNLVFAVGTICALITNSASEIKAGLILNGSFETAAVDPLTDGLVEDYVELSNSTQQMNNWIYGTEFPPLYVGNGTSGGVGLTEGAQDGSHYINLANNSSIFQSFAVTGGYTYEVSYYETSRTTSFDDPQVATISLLAGTGGTTQTANSPKAGSWALWTFQFTPSVSTTATLTFSHTNGIGSPVGTFVDNVDVNLSATPEPSGFLLLTLGIALVGLIKRRRTR